jgi:hypothetical protein
MRRIPAFFFTVIVLLAGTTRASAQSGYVAAALSADIVRDGTIDDTQTPGTGEAISFSLRAGKAIGRNVGVELDFTRPSTIESDDMSIPVDFTFEPIPGLGLPSQSLPDFVGYRIHTEQRTTTVTAAAWARQEITPRVSFVYLGGIAFARRSQTVTTSFDGLPVALAPFGLLPSIDTRVVDYSAGPMVGFEAQLGLTEHVRLVPGIRMLAITGGWTVRPAVGLGWNF